MQDRPNIQELVAAVGQFLERELIPTIADGRLRFRALVAANVLSIVGRELQVGEEPLRREWAGLVRLLGKDPAPEPASAVDLSASLLELNRELCARVRAGEMDAGPVCQAVLDHVQDALIAKLTVSNPRFLERLGR